MVPGIRVCGDVVCGWAVTSTLALGSGPSKAHPADESQQRAWFERAIGVPCRLVRQAPGSRSVRPQRATADDGRRSAGGVSVASRKPPPNSSSVVGIGRDGAASERDSVVGLGSRPSQSGSECLKQQAVGFANDGQYLLINSASLADLNARLAASGREGGLPLDERR